MFLDCSPNVLGPATHTYKRCTKCGEFKTLENFSVKRSRRDGRYSQCKECCRVLNKAWREANHDIEVALHKAWYEANKDYANQKAKAWYEANKDYQIEKSRTWRKSNKQRARDHQRQYRVVKPEVKQASDHRRRAQKAETGGTVTAAELVAIRTAQTDKRGRLICWKCGKPITDTPHLDHWQPLKHGGPNSPGNLHYMHAKCNLEKGAKLPAEIGRLL